MADRPELIGLNNIHITDSFWNKYTRLVTKEIIPYQWKALNDEVEDAEPSHCIKNFKIAAGLMEGEFEGAVFQDTDVAKWLEAVAYSLSYEPDKELEKTADEVIELIEKAQREDGYLDTFFIIKEPDHKFTNLREGHELYTAGHMIEAAVAYYQVTGKDRFLNVMRRCADLLCEVFHQERYLNAVPGHEEIELALVKLSRATGERKYMDLALDFVNRRGTEPNYLITEHEHGDWIDIFKDVNPFLPEYSQCHKPVREQSEAEGHAVRAVYLYCAMADLAYEYQDESLQKACERLYDNITGKRMYITGGIGSSGAYERFTTDYDLPNDCNYSESCASIGLALFCRRMLQNTKNAKYAETMERALINTVLSGIAMDGKSFFYVNPLEVWPDNCMDHTSMAHVKPVRQKWFGVACCPPNIARTLASLGEYVCMEKEEALWINLYVGSTIHTNWKNVPVTATLETAMPFAGSASIKLMSEKDISGKVLLRIPEYAEDVRVSINGTDMETEEISAHTDKGYLELPIELYAGSETVMELEFSMPAHFVYADEKVRADAGKTAVVKGPLVYCAEEVDNGNNLSELYIDTEAPLEESYEESILGGTMMVTAKGLRLKNAADREQKLYAEKPPVKEDVQIKLVPYCYWGNRKTGEMSVWIKRKL